MKFKKLDQISIIKFNQNESSVNFTFNSIKLGNLQKGNNIIINLIKKPKILFTIIII